MARRDKNLPKVLEQAGIPQTGDESFNSQLASFQLSIMSLYNKARRNQEKPEVLAKCFDSYLLLCSQYNMRITNSAAYTAIGIDRKTASDWRVGKRRFSDPRYQDLINSIDTLCSMNREQLMVENKVLPAIGIWWQKNYDKFQDDPEPDPIITGDDDEKTPEQIKEQYKYLLDDTDPPEAPE